MMTATEVRIARILDCVVSDRARRDCKMRFARSMVADGAPRSYVRSYIKSARIASRTAVQRLRYVRDLREEIRVDAILKAGF